VALAVTVGMTVLVRVIVAVSTGVRVLVGAAVLVGALVLVGAAVLVGPDVLVCAGVFVDGAAVLVAPLVAVAVEAGRVAVGVRAGLDESSSPQAAATRARARRGATIRMRIGQIWNACRASATPRDAATPCRAGF